MMINADDAWVRIRNNASLNFHLLWKNLTPNPNTHLINTSLSTGCFPNSLKKAGVNLLLKKPPLHPSELNHYRPVSLLLFLSTALSERSLIHSPPISTITTFLTLTSLVSRPLDWDCPPCCLWAASHCWSSLSLLCPHPSRPFCCIWHSEPPDPYFLPSGPGCLRLCSLPALILPQQPQLRVLSLLESLKVLSWVPSSSLCTPTLSALSFTHMAFPTTAMLMTPN